MSNCTQGLPQDAVPGAESAAQEGATAQGEQTALLPQEKLRAAVEPPECSATGNYARCRPLLSPNAPSLSVHLRRVHHAAKMTILIYTRSLVLNFLTCAATLWLRYYVVLYGCSIHNEGRLCYLLYMPLALSPSLSLSSLGLMYLCITLFT